MKNVIVHALLAIVGLSWAYRVWTSEQETERPSAEVEVIPCADRDFQRVELRTPHKKVILQRRHSDGEQVSWLQSIVLQKGKATTRKEFAGNKDADEYINEITPLRALRSLGKVDPKALDELGLKKPDIQLTLKCNNRTHTLSVGGSTFGSADRYAQVGKNGVAVLLKSDLIQTLESADTRLMQRKMQRFELNDIDEIRVIVGKKSRTLWQRDRRDAQRAQWVDKSKPDQRNELYGNWLRAVDALQVSDYLPPKVEPGQEGKGIAKTKARVLELVYTKEGAIKGTLRIDRVDGPTPEYFAQSGATHSWVRLVASSAKRVVEDAAVVVNGQSAPARNQPPQHQPPLQSLPHSPSAPPPAHP